MSRRNSSRKVSVIDDTQLESMGHAAELSRHFSFVSMLGLAFAILNSWTALATSLNLALPSGGPTSVLWGLFTAGICNMAIAISLAEFLSAYPTAGGQYHWVAVISWKRWMPLLSFITGWINVSGWIALTATGGLLGSQLIIGTIFLYHPDFKSHSWQQFLIYIGYTTFALCMNAFANKLLPHLNRAAFIWSLGGFAIISITVLACASPTYATGDFVFREFINQTNWPNGLAWLLGLLQGGLGLTGYDAVAHMIEEIPNATVHGPRIMIFCVAIGSFTGFIFLMVLLFVSGGSDNVQTIINTNRTPLLEIFYIATNSRVGSVCLLLFPLICLLFATTAIMTTSSRMTYAFARDGGVPFSKFFATINPALGVPINSLCLTFVLVIIFGCIFLGSSAAFNAIVSASVVALSLSYGMPIAVNVLRGRSRLGPRPFNLPPIVGWTANILGVCYIILTSVLFVFPPDLPVNASNMNYCIVALGIVAIVATTHWWWDARKNFIGPRFDMPQDILEAAESNTPSDPLAGYKAGADTKEA